MPVFKDDQEVYRYIGRLFQELGDDDELGPKFRKADTIVQYQYKNPDSQITVKMKDGEEGQVDRCAGEGSLVGKTQQQQGFCQVDRSAVDDVQAVDELAVELGWILLRHVEERLRDRQRGPQLVGGVGRESLLLGDLCFQPRKHRVEGVGELTKLVLTAFHLDPVAE